MRISARQKEILVHYMFTHPEFANDEFDGPTGQQDHDMEWDIVKSLLQDYGPNKTVTQWKTVWKDLKKKAQADLIRMNKSLEQSNKNKRVFKLSEITNKILAIIRDKEDILGEDTSVIKPPVATTSIPATSTPSISAPLEEKAVEPPKSLRGPTSYGNKTTSKQIEILVDYMYNHPNFAKAKILGGSKQQQTYNKHWTLLQAILKEYGPNKSVKFWQMTWRYLKKKSFAVSAKQKKVDGVQKNKKSRLFGTYSKILSIISKKKSRRSKKNKSGSIGKSLLTKPQQVRQSRKPCASKHRIRCSSRQLKILLDYMWAHPYFANGVIFNPGGKKELYRHWVRIKSMMKKYGPTKSIMQCQMIWGHLKKKAKVEYNRMKMTGGDYLLRSRLSCSTAKIMAIISFTRRSENEMTLEDFIEPEPPSPMILLSGRLFLSPPAAVSPSPPRLSPVPDPSPIPSKSDAEPIIEEPPANRNDKVFLEMMSYLKKRSILDAIKNRRDHLHRLYRQRMEKHQYMAPRHYYQPIAVPLLGSALSRIKLIRTQVAKKR